jgi:hypothetical protein
VLRDLKNGVTTKITHEELQALHNRRVAISTIAHPRQDLKEKGDNFFDREIIIDLVEVEQEVAPIIQTATEADLHKISGKQGHRDRQPIGHCWRMSYFGLDIISGFDTLHHASSKGQ